MGIPPPPAAQSTGKVRHMNRLPALLVAVVVALLVTTSGCGDTASMSSSGEPDAQKPTIAQDKAAVAKVVRDHFNAAVEGDAERACAHQTTRFSKYSIDEARSEESGMSIDVESCEELISAISAWMQSLIKPATFKVPAVRVTGNRAVATTRIATSLGPSRSEYKLVRAGDEWMIDGERDLDEETEITKATVQRWAKQWCTLDVGMTRAKVKSIMGRPSVEFDGSNGEEPQLDYNGFGYQFNAFFDIDDTVKQLDFAPGDDAIAVDCAESRR